VGNNRSAARHRKISRKRTTQNSWHYLAGAEWVLRQSATPHIRLPAAHRRATVARNRVARLKPTILCDYKYEFELAVFEIHRHEHAR